MEITKDMLEKLIIETLNEKKRMIHEASDHYRNVDPMESGYNTGLLVAYKRLLKRLEDH